MTFEKGYIPWNKGKLLSFEHRKKIGLKSKGRIAWSKGKSYMPSENSLKNLTSEFGFKKGFIPWITGKHYTEESNKKNSLAHLGKTPWNKGIKCPKISKSKIGFKHTQETKDILSKMAKGHHNPFKGKARPETRGVNSPNWKGGYGDERDKSMGKIEYKLWRLAVFERDKYTCKICNAKGVTLNADHILPWAKYPKLRYDINNGNTLCIKCHKLKTKEDWKRGLI